MRKLWDHNNLDNRLRCVPFAYMLHHFTKIFPDAFSAQSIPLRLLQGLWQAFTGATQLRGFQIRVLMEKGGSLYILFMLVSSRAKGDPCPLGMFKDIKKPVCIVSCGIQWKWGMRLQSRKRLQSVGHSKWGVKSTRSTKRAAHRSSAEWFRNSVQGTSKAASNPKWTPLIPHNTNLLNLFS